MKKMPTDMLNLAGEYRVCSELIKRGVFATITYGNRKAADVYAIRDKPKRVARIEVKASQQGNFVTRISQKQGLKDGRDAPDFWVLIQIKRKKKVEGRIPQFDERLFILTHKEMCQVQKQRNDSYARNYKKVHRREPDLSTGVDNVKVSDVEDRFEDKWDKIIRQLGNHARD